MIHINKPSEPPEILSKKQGELQNAIRRYGHIGKIPDGVLSKILNGYKHKDVKQALINCSHGKCAYCESKSPGNYLEVEHFAPKQFYPELTLDWDNLLPSCKKCNLYKHTHDTVNDPIINPCVEDPEPFFEYTFLKIYPSKDAPDYELAKKTIEVCKLNRSTLIEQRIIVLKALSQWETITEEKLRDLQSKEFLNSKLRTFLDLKENIANIEKISNNTELYAGLCKYFLKNCIVYEKAKKYEVFFQRYIDNLST